MSLPVTSQYPTLWHGACIQEVDLDGPSCVRPGVTSDTQYSGLNWARRSAQDRSRWRHDVEMDAGLSVCEQNAVWWWIDLRCWWCCVIMVDTGVISQCLLQTTSRRGAICMGGIVIIYILDILRVKNYLQVRKCKKIRRGTIYISH